MHTEHTLLDSKGLALQLGYQSIPDKEGVKYLLPDDKENSWLKEVHPAPGLFVTRAYLKPHQAFTQIYAPPYHGLWLCSFDSGKLTITEKGKKARQLQPGIHLIVYHSQPVKLTFSAPDRIVYTGITVSEHFIAGTLKDPPFTIETALALNREQYDTPPITLIFDQLKQTIMNGGLSLIYYQCKVLEILTLIQRNITCAGHWKRYLKSSRKSYLTYQNRKFIQKVQAEIDKDILHPPEISHLAMLAGMSLSKLNRCFKAWTGMTVVDYIRRRKMNYALRLLWADDKSIKNIANALGYLNASKFAAAFKKVHGFSPHHIRKSFGL